MDNVFKLISFLSLTTILICCDKEAVLQDAPEGHLKEVIIHATISDNDQQTKTSIYQNGKLYWAPEEVINVHSVSSTGATSATPFKFVSLNESPSLSVDFKGEAEIDDNEPYVALYPGIGSGSDSYWGDSSSGSQSGDSFTGYLSPSQNELYDTDVEANPFNTAGNAMMAAYSKAGVGMMTFQSICSGLKFTLSGEGITSVSLKGNNGEILAGSFSLDFQADSKGNMQPAVTPLEGQATEVILESQEGGFKTGTWIYLLTLPQTFDNGLTISFEYRDGAKKKVVLDQKISLSRSVWKRAQNLDLKAETVSEGYAAVDLGLSVLWAEINVGESDDYPYGYYFAWGETSQKSNYTVATYTHADSKQLLTKYCTASTYGTIDNKTRLEKVDDAAYTYMGGEWRMPTKEEWEELIENCSYSKSSGRIELVSKVEGYTDKSLSFPLGGYKKGTGTSGVSYSAIYWSSDLFFASSSYNARKASAVGWSSSSSRPFFLDQNNERWNGALVRAVLPK